MNTGTYNIVSVILISLTLVAGIATVIVYFNQLRVMQRRVETMQETLRAQNLAGLIQYLQEPDVRDARNMVLTTLRDKDYSEWSDKEKQEASTACAAYGVAGVLIRLGRVDRDVIVENWGPSITLVCDACEKLIAERQKQSGQKYWDALLWLHKEVKGVTSDHDPCRCLSLSRTSLGFQETYREPGLQRRLPLLGAHLLRIHEEAH